MTVFLIKSPDSLQLWARAEGPGGAIGDACYTVAPGQSLLGKTYEEWAALPDGPYEDSSTTTFADDDEGEGDPYHTALLEATVAAESIGLVDSFQAGTCTDAELRAIVHAIAERAADELRTEAESLAALLAPVPFSHFASFGVRDAVRAFFGKALKVVKTASLAAALTLMGPQELTVEESKILTAQVVTQENYLKNFEAEVVAGSQSPGGIPARAAMYGHAVWGTALNTQRQALIDSGEVTEELNNLGTADHCQQCPEETAKGWVPIGTLVPVGQRECRVACRCWLSYR